MKQKGISLIIIFHKRYQHLFNTLEGLKNGSRKPNQLILVEMDDKKSALPQINISHEHILLKVKNSSSLPIAEARNLGAIWADYSILAFLDVDCIPSKNYIESIASLNIKNDYLYMGQPKYLTSRQKTYDDILLEKLSEIHPHRPSQNNVVECEDYGMFWSLTFFLTQQTFSKINGFDIKYSGYGAEDTDFSFTARSKNIRFVLTPFDVYHQQHAFCRPPLNSLKSIVNNCNHFYSKWKHWPMANYLDQFADRGLIAWEENQNQPISIVALPAKRDVEMALVSNEPYA